jgi:hypothetical protein
MTLKGRVAGPLAESEHRPDQTTRQDARSNVVEEQLTRLGRPRALLTAEEAPAPQRSDLLTFSSDA